MKKFAAILGTLLVVLMAVALIACEGNGNSGGGGGGGDDPRFVAATVAGSGSWKNIPGWNNEAEESKFKVEGAKEGTNGVIKVSFSGTAGGQVTELFADFPSVIDVTNYDGITFKIYYSKAQFSEFFLSEREGEAGDNDINWAGKNTFRIAGESIFGADKTWETKKIAFDPASIENPGWNGGSDGWNTITDSITRILFINHIPVEDTTAGDYVIYLDDIGFYKGENSSIVWSFDVE